MKSEYNFEKAKKNPYVKMLKKQITIRLEQNTINYFKNLAKDTGVPYQTLIDMYLTDCANKKKKLALHWSA
jgi:predicted DNA binding CopG/RHH family protein